MRYIRFSYAVGLLLGATLLSGCSKELELEPESDLLSVKQIEEAGDAFDNRALASVDGMYAELKLFAKFGNGRNQRDIGIPAISLELDHRTDNMWSSCISYDWYSDALDYSSFTPDFFITRQFYNSFYNFIGAANKILLASKEDATSEAVQNARAQAKAFRAWAYFNLVQAYQFTYVDNKDKPAVPLVTEDMTFAQLINNPRASVEKIYEFIVNNLEQAKEKLTGKGQAPSNAWIDEFVVYGLLARVYLVMQQYDKAAEAAKYVIDNSGLKPYSLKEAGAPGLCDIADHNVLWGIPISSDDDVVQTGICNWESFVSLMNGDRGYCGAGVPRCINPALHDSIHKDDVRKALWITYLKNDKGDVIEESLDGLVNYFKVFGAMKDAEALKAARAYMDKFELEVTYANVKFGPANNDINLEENSADYIMMRIEEMYYIYFEALGETAGKTAMESWIDKYRQPGYKFPAGKSFFDEIYRQRRIEFWGEMLSYYDMMRFKKGMYREGVKEIEKKKGMKYYPDKTRFNLAADDPAMLYCFPRQEILQNPGVVQNELGGEQSDTF